MSRLTDEDPMLAEVRASMARKRCTRSDLSAHLKLSRGAVQRRLAGEVPFRAAELVAMAELLDVPVSTFYMSPAQAPAAASG